MPARRVRSASTSSSVPVGLSEPGSGRRPVEALGELRLDTGAGCHLRHRQRGPSAQRERRRDHRKLSLRPFEVLDRRAELEQIADQLEPVGGVGRVGVVQAAGLELGGVDRAVSHRSRGG